MYLINRHGHKPFFMRPARIAPHIMSSGNSVLLPDEMLHISLGSVIINATAIRRGSAYRASTGDFTLVSRDGLASGANVTEFVSGGLQSLGQQGTSIRLVPHEDPLPTNIYLEDEDA